MKTTLLIVLLVASGCGPLPAGEIDQAVLGGTTGRTVPPPPQLLTITLDQIDPRVPVEWRPVYFHFTLDNSTKLVRNGSVQAVITDEKGATFVSSPWSINSLAAYSSTSGVVEFDSPYAGPAVSWAIHYYDSSNPSVPAETSPTQATFPSAVRASYGVDAVAVANAADQTLGDNDTLYINTVLNGSMFSVENMGLGYLHGGEGSEGFEVPSVDLVPGTSNSATFSYRVGRMPFSLWAQAAEVTMAALDFPVTGQLVRAWTDLDTDHRQHFDLWFCNDVIQTTCPSGAYYYVDTYVRRWQRSDDTLPLGNRVVQVQAGQAELIAYATGLTFQVPAGVGTVVTQPGAYTFLAPPYVGAPQTFTITATGNTPSGPKSELIYVEIRP